MRVKKPELPRLVLEDYMSMLRALVMLAWVGLVLAVATQGALSASAVYSWPDTGRFSQSFNAILIEFGLNTLALTALLLYRNWYERIPRESALRLRWLLIAVIFWLSLHLFAVFHVVGGFTGPLMPLLPVLVIAALVAFPNKAGWLLSAYLLIGHLGVLVLESSNLIAAQGELSAQFSLAGNGRLSPYGLSALLAVLLLTASFAFSLRRWLYACSHNLGPAQRIDSDSGLFKCSFLVHRVDMELGRIRRQGGSAALLLIGFDQTETDEAVAGLASALIKQIRLHSDTPAVYKPGVLAVLLPGAGSEVVNFAVKRIVGAVFQATGAQRQFRAAAAVASSGEMSTQKLMTLAEEALAQAEKGGAPVIVSS